MHGLARLAEPVDVDDRGEVVEARNRRRARTPPRSSPRPSHSRRTAPRRGTAGARGACRRARRRRRSAGPARVSRWPRRPMAARESGGPRGGSRAAEGQQLLVGDRAGRLEHAVVERRGVPLGEDQVIVAGVLGMVEVVAQVAGEQHRHQVGGGHRRRGVAGAGGVARPDRVDAKLLSELARSWHLPWARSYPPRELANTDPFRGSITVRLSVRALAGDDPGRDLVAPESPADRRAERRRHRRHRGAQSQGQRGHLDLGAISLDRRDHRVGHVFGRPGADPRGSLTPASANIPASRMNPGSTTDTPTP